MLRTEPQSGNARYFVRWHSCEKSNRRGLCGRAGLFCMGIGRRSAGGDIAARLRRLGEKRHEARRRVKAAVGGDDTPE